MSIEYKLKQINEAFNNLTGLTPKVSTAIHVGGIAPPTILSFMLLISLLEAQLSDKHQHAYYLEPNPVIQGDQHMRRTLGVA
jgi:hypothetical protein